MKKTIIALKKAKTVYDIKLKELEIKAREVCDFNARITWCEGDGHLVLNEETTSVATLDCLFGRSATNKLSEDEHLKFCI